MDIFWLSAIQGITEFIPVSSSGHLFVISALFSLKGFGRSTEVFLNFATLIVVLIYFRIEIKELFFSFLQALKGKFSSKFHQGLKICVATLPVIGFGFLVHTYFDHLTHSFRLFGYLSILCGGFLVVADKIGSVSKTYNQISYKNALLIGCAQVLALIPGVSRLGASLTMSRLLGYKRFDSAKFSFLTSIPIGIGATVLLTYKASQSAYFHFGFDFFIIGMVCFFIGLSTLYFFMWWLKKRTLLIWGLYRILLGFFILYYFNQF